MKFDIDDKQLREAAKSMSMVTALIEASDWDETRALTIFKQAFDALINLYEYNEYDNSLIQNKNDYERLMRENIKLQITDREFEAVLDLIDDKVKEKAKQQSDRCDNN
ncbi:MAG: hypothetical protein CMI54_07610 [Parcubacteria group bacterium]|nr:hypothetical protein [Parcubacteria group bacterium]|tara:strand:+ start:2126 stop:2449 length:324 start_codon:yes stop_codon:yes gene_type:complete